MNIQIKPTLANHGDIKAEKTIQWQSKSGSTIFIEEMTDSHLDNAINLLNKRYQGNDIALLAVREIMKLEHQRRQYARGGEIEVAITNRKIDFYRTLKQGKETFTFNIH